MAGTSLKRKARRNKAKAKQRNQRIKLITFKPVPKKVDIEEIKSSFKTPAKKKEEPVKEEPVAGTEVVQEKAKVVKTEKKGKPETKKTTTGKDIKSKTQKRKLPKTTGDKSNKDVKKGIEEKSEDKEN